MDDRAKKDLTEIIEGVFDKKFDQKFQENFNAQFDQAFNRNFNDKFDQAFDRNFDAKFDQAFDRNFGKKFEDKFIPLFNQGFEEVIEPYLEGLEQGIKEDFNNRFDRLETKIDRVVDKGLVHDNQLKNHDKRLKRLESKRAIA